MEDQGPISHTSSCNRTGGQSRLRRTADRGTRLRVAKGALDTASRSLVGSTRLQPKPPPEIGKRTFRTVIMEHRHYDHSKRTSTHQPSPPSCCLGRPAEEAIRCSAKSDEKRERGELTSAETGSAKVEHVGHERTLQSPFAIGYESDERVHPPIEKPKRFRTSSGAYAVEFSGV